MANEITAVALVKAIGEWATQFPYHNPTLGILEELGEFSHVLLKSRQNIKEYKDCSPDNIIDAIEDSLADAAIFTAHWCYRNDAGFSWYTAESFAPKFDEQHAIDNCLTALKIIMHADMHNEYIKQLGYSGVMKTGDMVQHAAQGMVTALWALANCFNINLREATEQTWMNIVRKRNFNAKRKM